MSDKKASEQKIINKPESFLLSKRNEIYEIINLVYNFVHYIGAKETQFSITLVDIRNNLAGSYDEESISKAVEELSKANIDIKMILDETSVLKNNYLNILKMLSEQSIKFLLKISLVQCLEFREKVEDDEYEFISPYDIMDLEKCFIFIQSLKVENNFSNISDLELIKLFIKKIQASSEDLGIYFKSYTTNFIEIKNLFYGIKDGSNFTLRNTNTKFFYGKYYKEIENEGKIEKKINTIQELLELKTNAQLTNKIFGNEIVPKIFLDKFIAIISGIHDIYILLRKINVSGYTNDIEIKIKINDNDYNYTIVWETENNCHDFKKVIGKLTDILNTLKDSQIKAYETKPLIRFIYGKQFNLIKSLENNMDNKKIDPLLMFSTRNLKTIKPKDFKFSWKNDIQSVIDDCENYLNEVLKINNLNLETIYKDSLIHKEYKNKGVYINYIDRSENLGRDLFLIYKYLTKNFPVSQNILLCTKETSKNELTAFLYRALLCQYNACFMMGGIESLESNKRAKIYRY